MESQLEQAVARHRKGYNCAQAVVCTYCSHFHVDENTAYRMAESFGLGMGTQSVCGALSGALMLAGLKNSAGTDAPGTTKGATYAYARELTAAFEKTVGSLLCSEIKSQPVKCSCTGCIEAAARLIEQHLL